MSRATSRAAVLAVVLLPAAVLAQGWTINHHSGVSVMGEISVVYFTVTNTHATQRLDTISISFPNAGNSAKDFDIEGGVPVPGWRVSTVDKLNKLVTFSANGGCPRGLGPAESVVVGVKLVSQAASADLSETLAFNGNKTAAQNTCASPTYTFPAFGGSPNFKRVGLAASLNAQPRTLDVNGKVTATLSVTNRTTSTQSGVWALQPSLIATPGVTLANMGVSAGPSPSSLTLAPDQTGTITWELTANSRGLASLRAVAQNPQATVTSEEALSMQINVGEFPGMVSLNPYELGFGSQVTNGGTVTVHLTVSNNGTELMTGVSPNPPSFSGTAAAALVSGPTPPSVATLSPGNSARFSWTYQVTGQPGDSYRFTANATATRGGLVIASDPVNSATGYVVTHTARANPRAVQSGSVNRTIAYTVSNGGSQNIQSVGLIPPENFTVAANFAAADTSGWNPSAPGGKQKEYVFAAPNAGAQIPPGGSKTFTVSYSAVGTVTQTTTLTHRLVLTQADSSTVRVEAGVTIFVVRPIPEVKAIGVLAGNGKNTVIWTNPLDHDGVLVLRATGGPPNTAPVQGTRYNAGQTLGNAQVLYSDSESFSTSFVDSGLSNGTPYFYKVYNHDEFFIYSAGQAPSSNGVFSTPTTKVFPSPIWCYSFGMPTSIQPVTELGAAVFTASNAGTVTANVTAPGASDGSERWRPVSLRAPVQGRFLVTSLSGLPSKYIVVGDQLGYAYAIDSATGLIKWTGFGGVALGNAIQAQPGVQLNAYSNAAFQSAHGGIDLVFFATRDASTTTNRVYALRSDTGQARWTYSPGDLDIVNGGMMVDYANNRLWVAARGTNSVRVINTLDGKEVTRFALGPSDHAINYHGGKAIITTNGGAVHAIDVSTLAPVWNHSVGTMTSYAFPTGNGFIASLASGTVQRYLVDQTTTPATITALWTAPPAIPGPTGIRVEYGSQKIYVGDSTGKIHQLNPATGAIEASVSLSNQAVTSPTIDTATNPMRLHVGTLDGRICALQLPF